MRALLPVVLLVAACTTPCPEECVDDPDIHRSPNDLAQAVAAFDFDCVEDTESSGSGPTCGSVYHCTSAKHGPVVWLSYPDQTGNTLEYFSETSGEIIGRRIGSDDDVSCGDGSAESAWTGTPVCDCENHSEYTPE